MVRFLTTVVAVAVIAAACGGDSADIANTVEPTETVGAVVLPNSSSPESVGEDLLIDPTTDVESSGRPVVLWFWAPG
jgi:hypothetical protein